MTHAHHPGPGGHPHAHAPVHAHSGGGHHHHAPASFGRAFAIGVALNICYVGAEAAWGVLAHSLSLLADAGHNLGDVLGLLSAWIASGLARRRPFGRFTYGLRRSSILSALANAVLLLVVTGGIGWEAVRRLLEPEPVAGRVVMITAAIGILVNGFTALLFASGRNEDLNLRGAFLHMASDALMAVAVVAAGGVMWLTGSDWVDPVASLLVGLGIVAGTWSLLRQSLELAMDAVPPGIDHGAVAGFLRQLPGVTDLHDLHIWGMSTTETALTAHLVRPESGIDDALLQQAALDLRERYGIGHATLQIEHGRQGQCTQACPGEV